jgi:hypothetical protein
MRWIINLTALRVTVCLAFALVVHCDYFRLTPMGKPPPLAVRFAKALPFQRGRLLAGLVNLFRIASTVARGWSGLMTVCDCQRPRAVVLVASLAMVQRLPLPIPCEWYLEAEQYHVEKEHTQKIKSTYINLWTRINRCVRHTICLPKTAPMHDLVIGLCINRYACGRSL